MAEIIYIRATNIPSEPEIGTSGTAEPNGIYGTSGSSGISNEGQFPRFAWDPEYIKKQNGYDNS